MFCPKCGKELQEGSIFCGACGNKLSFSPMSEEPFDNNGASHDNQNSEASSEKSIFKKTLLISFAAAVVAVSAVIIVCISIFSSDTSGALFKRNRLLVSSFDGSSYFIDEKGNVVSDGAKDALYFLTETSDYILYTNDKGKYGYISSDGKTAINPQFDFASMFDESGLAAVRLGDKMGYINKTGKYVVNPQFDSAYPFGDDKYAVVCSGSKYGFINKKGKIVINPQFDYAEEFADNNTALVRSGGKYGYIDRNGKYVINPQFDKAYTFMENGLAKVYINGQFGFIDKTGKYVINPQFDTASDFDCKGLSAVSSDGRYGYIDKKGNYVINPQFDYAGSFAENGLAAVCMNGVCGYINKKGEFEINPQYENAFDFSECGIARVVADGKYRYIDKKGNTVVLQDYEYGLDYYSDGYTVVFDDSAHIINKNGEQLPTGTIESCVSFDSNLINDLIYAMDNIDLDMDFSSEAESVAYLNEILGDELFEQTMWFAEYAYHYDMKYSNANSIARDVFMTASGILSKYNASDIDVPDGMYYGSLSYADNKPKLTIKKGDNKEFADNMLSEMGSTEADAGYFAIYIKDGGIVRSFWSKDPQLADKAKKKVLTENEEFNCIVGGYPTEINMS